MGGALALLAPPTKLSWFLSLALACNTDYRSVFTDCNSQAEDFYLIYYLIYIYFLKKIDMQEVDPEAL